MKAQFSTCERLARAFFSFLSILLTMDTKSELRYLRFSYGQVRGPLMMAFLDANGNLPVDITKRVTPKPQTSLAVLRSLLAKTSGAR